VLPLAGASAYARKTTTYGTPVREAKVASGFILLLLIGILIGFVVSRVRKRMGLGVTWSTWVTTVVVVGFILLLMWVTAYKH
jgi:hypothetical protein